MPLSALPQFLAVGSLWTVAVVTPGPNFLVSARVASARSRRAGLAAVAGIGLGTVLWGLAGAFGIRAMFDWAPRLYAALTVIGAAYLIFLGGKLVVSSFRPAPPDARDAALGPAFAQGFLTSVSNPKSALLVASLFAAVMPRHASLSDSLGAVVEMAAISVVWYGFVACLLSTRRAAETFARLRRWVDRLAGCVFMAFGLRLICERA